jgi:phosphoenolpyruvate carboxylase
MERNDPSSVPAEPDEALRIDVRVLGNLLGEVLRTQGGSDVYETVEQVRKQGKALLVLWDHFWDRIARY